MTLKLLGLNSTPYYLLISCVGIHFRLELHCLSPDLDLGPLLLIDFEGCW